MVKEITCNQTRVVTTHRVMSADLNEHDDDVWGEVTFAMVDAEAWRRSGWPGDGGDR